MRRVHITGASGAGVTTLGAALADAMGAVHFDTDDFYWEKTDPPFTTKRPIEARLEALRAAFARAPEGWVLSGSITSWGKPLEPLFDAIVFVLTSPAVRAARIAARERQRYGAAIEPGGAMYESSQAFQAWAAGYDRSDFPGRSRAVHEAWLGTLSCPVIRLDGDKPTALLVREVRTIWG